MCQGKDNDREVNVDRMAKRNYRTEELYMLLPFNWPGPKNINDDTESGLHLPCTVVIHYLLKWPSYVGNILIFNPKY